MTDDDIWTHIIELHQYAKEMMIKGEEICGNFDYETFLQPLQEHRHVLEHIIRARYEELKSEGEKNHNYIRQNLEKALGHEYRCFFDTADWLSIIIRSAINHQMSKYPPECISAVFPEYYEKIRPSLEKINIKIAEVRESKDVPKTDNIIPEVKKYRDQINILIEKLESIPAFIPQLEEKLNEIKKKKLFDYLWPFVLVILSFIFGWISK